MIVVLSGEGPSDLGCCRNDQGQCQHPNFLPGPMTCFVDKEIERSIDYSLLEITPEQYIFISKIELINAAQRLRENKKSMSLTGKRRPGVETGFFYLNARMLGEITRHLAEEHDDQAIAVLFRDCDGTRSDNASLWQDKVNSIRHGFSDAGLGSRGVAMVPKPKSEAWMLCVLRDNYQQCARLESLSGNDNVPNSAKAQLTTALNGEASTVAQLQHLDATVIDTDRLAEQMPSYGEFHQDIAIAYRDAIAL
ncbi:hypothetical protein [Serratia proteamaculans]|uniref:DUF4276 family protein n=1 Tax=Serratia proteamaculans TaxID=28151 RepID=A0A5Q2V9L6_SERPR|nr:hypothetical protein [Serratia proteamaculans]QGH60231.1 hypothetical protein GHV41_04975 [Serratia proteamaculans]